MKLFHVVEDATVILKTKKGVYRQAKVYRRGDDVYAGLGSGFVRLVAANGTTCPDILWSDLSCPGAYVPRIGNPKFGIDPEIIGKTFKNAA